ncbi:16S rRNA (cytosine(967)-C(5))-methyltransferase [Thermoleptolyngbya sichuanensis A183]|uniref:16S rRNA (cytosine(967)-C(5))-methyltransferase n=1 Tax=Thermoleptolyngbya sichuanensis A183 TaxID=2737172 RepID=A0A6M8BDX3_9CYAN|nr:MULTISPECIES: 16S rRNA (cytosine(967)-C(5))-methyltransferase [Thermoleptolyngbya]QKD84332.1 16S rRNA (cytosine(967)-C(5))-methyltransferase [Thermoleptolyngbya sichuanensis A183]
MSQTVGQNLRQVALDALRDVERGAFADAALDKRLHRGDLSERDCRLATELVYGCVRRQRTLDALISQLATKPADQQPPNLRLILHLGLYQLRYLSHIPPSAAVDTTVDLAKGNGFAGLAGFVNGLLRGYIRQAAEREAGDPLNLPADPVSRIGIAHSMPDWIVQQWIAQFGETDAEQLCNWFNQPPSIDLRVNPLRASVEQVEAAMQAADVAVERLTGFPQALRLRNHRGAIPALPGYAEGWWSVQDASAQLVGMLLDPQPGETVIDACAAPGGKTTHLAELMGDRGVVWAGDRSANRLKKVLQNAERLQLTSIQLCPGDSRTLTQFPKQADRVLLDAPCSGLGTLHRHADARWRQTPDSVQELSQLQAELLHRVATWVKPGGTLVYATCTLHPDENERVVQDFLAAQPQWKIDLLPTDHPAIQFQQPQGWLRILPHQHDLDGFFMARLISSDRTLPAGNPDQGDMAK